MSPGPAHAVAPPSPGVRPRGFVASVLGGLVCGILSAVLGKILLTLLTLVFLLPIVLTGPIGVLVVQACVNAILLGLTARLVDGLEFERRRTVFWAAVALTALQTIAKLLV